MNADNLLTGMIAIELGLITEPQLTECVNRQEGTLDPRPIGEILRQSGYLTPGQLERLLTEQKRRMDEFSEARLFGQVALYKNLVTPPQLGECIREQLRQSPSTERPLIGEVMVKKGYLTLGQFVEVIAAQGKALFRCEKCEAFQAYGSNIALAQAVCRKCGKMLRLIQDTTELKAAGKRKGDTTVFFKVPLANLGKFEILGEIARGGMSIVFKAHDASLDRTVALKVLKEGDADATFIKRLHREGALAAKLHHPNIVTIHEVGETEGLHYLCMDFITGVDFMEFVRRGKVDRRRQLQLLETVARAVHYAHARGVIHRDLKPSNILVDRSGTPFITDFGLAKSLDTSFSLTKEGVAMGTPYYMPPEQVLGKQDEIDPRSDVYSLGVILYEMLTGSPPFSGASTIDIYQKILSEEPVRPSQIDRSIDPDLEAICLKALDKERDLRYMSAEDLAIDLGRYLSGEPVMATRATGARILAKKFRKHRARILTLMAVVALAVGASFVFMSVRNARRVNEVSAEADRSFGAQRWEDARAAYTQLVALDPGNAEAHRRLGVCDARIDEARREAKRKAEEEGRRQLEEEKAKKQAGARPHFDAGFRKYNEAMTLMHQPDFNPRLLEERFRDAGRDFTKALDRDPDYADAYFLRGKCSENLNRVIDAEKDFTFAIRKSPNHSAAYFERGKLRFQRAYMASGTRYGNFSREGNFQFEFVDSPRPEIEALKKDAREDFETSLETSASSPRPDERFLIDAFMSLADGRYHQAVVRFTQSIGVNEVNPDAYFGRGFTHLILGEFDLAIQHLSEAIRLKPNLYPAYSMRATAYFAKGDYETAEREYEAASKRFPHSAVYYNYGMLLATLGKWEKALKAVEAAIDEEPGDLTMEMMRANILFQLRRFRDAIKACHDVMEKDPRHDKAYKLAAVCHASLGENELALNYFKRAYEIDPRDDQNLSNWAATCWEVRDAKGAWDAASKAIAINPKNTHAILVRALVHRVRGEHANSLAEIEKALALEPNYGKAHLHKGIALSFLRRYDEAFASLKLAVKLDPSLEDMARKLEEEIRKDMGKE